ncbi:TPA: site-specific DNA-methyltransferase [Pseudomonas aeruginosa]|uniref:site-specific DNA-methyltransferase n=1 Tax=Pseudomonas aeruginosa TaxID=287 RepID=UPI002936D46A|nr:site-specific DNA-methyltransferase [Pseudomonas aeruginosa]MDV2706384.1 site-specific DNA-methyltransferase [Pseudomonas aeruginosa]MDX4001250.1 site-specific DNA-methyltransferase [Pseudomonas aeruginosa]HCF1011792.1 site-specific DNA-methyltransferase [Pseudomonas aeruginosa]HEK1595485.1 site-specific DNA-methyltransferase [Pseudomonas aeruginosa]
MDTLKMHSPSIVEENIARIREMFPHCVTEARDDAGNLRKLVDFEKLRQELSPVIVDGMQERYHLNWPGKREAVLTANAPIAKTLRPVREESIDFDTTRNLFIEGDNLDALKMLQETYLGRIKMIYIDPPYNTGSDFIYEDDFAQETEEYLRSSNQKDDEGNRLSANTSANGRFHSDWLSMMLPRLRLARHLLRDDGVIFISIDDSEAANLKLLCDEIFGAQNFYCNFVWKRRSGAMDSVDNTSVDHEYVLCYGKNKGRLAGIGRTYAGYTNPDNDPRGPWKADNLSAGKAGGDVYYPIKDPVTGNEFLPPQGRYWPYSRKTMAEKISEGKVIFPADASGRPMLKRFKNEAKFDTVPVSTWMVSRADNKVSNSLIAPSNTQATRELQDILNAKLFPHPKSTQLIESLASQCLSDDDDDEIVLDFFSGSGTTAHAILARNATCSTNTRFILVQLPEVCPPESAAANAGFSTIADIARERIRRVGDQFRSSDAKVDVGFRSLKIDTSNMADVYYAPDALDKANLDLFVDNIKPDRKAEDLLFQVMLDWGVDLALPIEKKVIQGKDVFFVDGNALAACFDAHGGVDEAFVKELATHKPLRVVFRDAGFKDSAVKINVEQIFKLLSPSTEVKSI